MDVNMLKAAEQLAQSHMDSYNDVSHDWLHVKRVRSLALKLAGNPSIAPTVDHTVLQLAALFHDLHDSKYSATTSAYEDLHARFFEEWLERGSISLQQAQLVARICDNVSYSTEVKRIANNTQTPWHETCTELHIVQDADKLDAMGAIGIMRCAAFSAAKHRPLYAKDNPNDSLSHLDDKLLKLKGMMRTPLGKEMATQRHAALEAFVSQARREIEDLDL